MQKFQRIKHKARTGKGNNFFQFFHNCMRFHAAVTHFTCTNNNQSDSGGKIQGIYRINVFQLLRGKQRIIIGNGQARAQVDMHNRIALFCKPFKKFLIFPRADGRCFWKLLFFTVLRVNIIWRNIHTITIHPII